MGPIVISAFLVFWISAAVAQPVNTNYLPKEYYQRQNLPEIPGYIPVYIKHDDEPILKYVNEGGQGDDKGTHQSAVAEETEKEPAPPQVRFFDAGSSGSRVRPAGKITK